MEKILGKKYVKTQTHHTFEQKALPPVPQRYVPTLVRTQHFLTPFLSSKDNDNAYVQLILQNLQRSKHQIVHKKNKQKKYLTSLPVDTH
jgi:hypothetical protein